MALGFFSRLKEGLSRSTQKLTGGITAALHQAQLDDAALEELEELLIAADLGPAAAQHIIDEFRRSRFGQDVTDERGQAGARRGDRQYPRARGAAAGDRPLAASRTSCWWSA